MGFKAAVQVLKQADVLKAKLTRNCDLLNDSEVWTNQQQLQTIYHQVLVLDLEYALDKKVEQELWMLGFKNHISTLQELAKDKKNPRRQDSQALLSWCLEAASGFYITLLQELCTTFDLDLPFRRSGSVYGQIKSGSCCEQVTLPQSSSCLYICQYCLVHLGDIARYRNQRNQAESFYKQAIVVSPTSGQPYNQLALLEASLGDKLSTVFHYVRAIAVKNPFPASATNLSTTLSSSIDKDGPIGEVLTKMSVSKLARLFLHIHGLLHTTSELDQAELGVRSINSTLTALVATQGFTDDKLIKMTVINMYALWHIAGMATTKVDELTSDELKSRELILDLIAGSLSAFLLPIYTLKHDETLLDYYALPAIKLICCWIEKEPGILSESVFASRLQIWPGFCKLLNYLQPHINEFDWDRHAKTPLTEDKELQGFLPLSESFREFDFKSDTLQSAPDLEKHVRARRLVNFGVWLTSYEINNSKVMISTKDDSGSVTFEPGCMQPDPTDQLLELMKSVNTSDTGEVKKPKGLEKRAGILKPQGSLEKSREEREQNNSTEVTGNSGTLKAENKLKRVKQNVALQSIFKRMEENKQVKFSEEATGKEIEKVAKQKPAIKAPIASAQQQVNQTYRTQTFNQNHPGLTNNLHQEFFNSGFQGHPNINEPPKNIYFPGGDVKNNLANSLSKIPQNIQFSVPPPPVPMRMVPGANQNNMNYKSNVIEKPGSVSMPSVPMPSVPMTMPLNQSMPYRNVPWSNEERTHSGSTWWGNQQVPQQGDNYQPRENYGMNYPYNVPPPPPYGQSNNIPINMDMNHQQPNQNSLYSPWGNTQRNPINSAQVHGFGNSNQGMTMRQAMLNETKHMGPIGSNPHTLGSNLPNATDNMQGANKPGYTLFDTTNWTPSLTHLRSSDGSSQRPVGNLPHQSLFSGPSHSSLMQLLEQQNQYQKNEK